MNNTKYYEVPYNSAYADKNGFAKILLSCGDFVIPVEAKPSLLGEKAEVLDNEELSVKEIKRLNLTRWTIRPVPELIKLFNKDVIEQLNNVDYTLYWNGGAECWEFFDQDNYVYINKSEYDKEERDNINNTLDELIDTLRPKLYQPHLDESGNYGNDNVHAVYDSFFNKKMFTDK